MQHTGESRDFLVVGKSVPMIDAKAKVVGLARYTMDLYPRGTLYAKVKRSPLPHATIKSIDISRAKALPGIIDVVTAGESHSRRYGQIILDQEVLASEKARFVGEPVAAVAATSLEAAEEALELIDVKYEELPAVLDPEQALSETPPAVVHPNLLRYGSEIDVRLGSIGLDPKRPNLGAHFKVRWGDVEKGFARADLVVENRFTTQMMHAVPLEPFVSVTQMAEDGTLEVYTSTQTPFGVRQTLSRALDLPIAKIRVYTPCVGGGFGCKLDMKAEAVCGLLTLRTRRPVRLEFTREETFVCGSVRHPFIIDIKDGVTKDGLLTARQMKLILDGGAYAGLGISVAKSSMYGTSEVYKVDNFWLDSYRAYTNKPHGGAFRGFGCAQSEWAIESQMDILADKLGMDKVEFRLKNMLKPGDVTIIGERVTEDTVRTCLLRASEAIQWGQPKRPGHGPWKVGRGFASGAKYSRAPTIAAAEVKVWPEGYIEARTGAIDIGEGAYTVLAQIVAEEFRVPLEKVIIVHGDTHVNPPDEGAYSSRQTFNSGSALILACRDAKREVFERAARILDANPEDLDTEDSRVFKKGEPGTSIAIRDLFRLSNYGGYVLPDGGEILGAATWISPSQGTDPETGQVRGEKANSFYTYIATAAEVEVNEETGQVKVVKMISAVDVGRPINPLGVEGQIEGCMGIGLGSTLLEEMVVEDGNVLNADFLNYKVPTPLETPEDMETILVENVYPGGPFGGKGSGEIGIVVIAPAIANAIQDAIGVRVKDLPITPHRILSHLPET